MKIPAEGLALYQVVSNRSENKGAKAVSESAALGAGFPDALPRQRPARDKNPAPDIEKEGHQRGRNSQQSGAESRPQADRRKEKQPVLIDTRVRRSPDLANGTVIDVKI
jgi:hypothetical protein